MIRFVYPTVDISKSEFTGCIRLPIADKQLDTDSFYLNLNEVGVSNPFKNARSLLAGDSYNSSKDIYPLRDKGSETNGYGSSNELAFLFAYINFAKPIVWDSEAFNHDIWCTGTIADHNGVPWLGRVYLGEFGVKLSGFLDDSNPDKLFIVPIENAVASRVDLDELENQGRIRVIGLDYLTQAGFSVGELFSRKTILQVCGNELVQLTRLIFDCYSDIIKSVREKAARTTRETLDRLKGNIYRAYSERLYTTPAGWPPLFKDFCSDSRPGMILIAPSGTGKSCLLCAVADRDSEIYQGEGFTNHLDTTFFWSGVNAPADLGRAFLSMIEAEGLMDVNGFFRSLKRHQDRILFIIDGINQHLNDSELFESICRFSEEINKAEIGENIKIIASIRSDAVNKYYNHIRESANCFFPARIKRFSHDKNSIDHSFIDLSLFSGGDHFEQVYSRYRETINKNAPEYKDLPEDIKKVLNLPLMTRIMFEIHGEHAEAFSLMGEEKLLESYVSHHCKKCTEAKSTIQPSGARYIIKSIAKYRYEHPDERLAYARVQSAFERQISEAAAYEFSQVFSILCETGFLSSNNDNSPSYNGDIFQFSHEQILEHLIMNDIFKSQIAAGFESFAAEIRTKPAHSWIVNPFKKSIRDYFLEGTGDFVEAMGRTLCLQAGDVGITAFARLFGELWASQQEAYKPHLEDMNKVIGELNEEQVHKIFEILRRYYFDVIPVSHRRYNGTARKKKSSKDNLWASYHDRFSKDTSDPLSFAESAMWYADSLYNRADNYKDAIDVLKNSIKILKQHSSDPAIERKIYEIEYQLAVIYSDYGKSEKASAIAQRYLQFYEKKQTESDVYRLGYARGLFLNYMLVGDNAGKFQDSIENLEKAGEIFNKLDKKAYGRYLVNKAVATLFTNSNFFNIRDDNCTQIKAARICDQAIQHCEEVSNDLPGKAYAFLIKASAHIQRANIAHYLKEDAIKEKSLQDATDSLNSAEEIFNKTRERYVQDLILANKAMILFLQGDGDRKGAIAKLKEVKKSAKSETGDFFNYLDASLDIAHMEANAKNVDKQIGKIEKLIEAANKNQYAQAALRGLWYLWELKREYEKIDDGKLKARALRFAKELKWGSDYRRVIYSPWYAGIHL